MILAGDIGGTKTYLALFDWHETRVEPIREEKFLNADFDSFEEILEEFLQARTAKDAGEESDETVAETDAAPSTETEATPGTETDATPNAAEADHVDISPSMPLRAVCFGVAGPVVDNRCRATNLPWIIDGHALTETLNTSCVHLINDVEAAAHGVLILEPEEIEMIQGEPQETGTKVLVAPGTGLGEAMLYWDGERYRAVPSEGGHASFAPTSDLAIELLRYLRTSFLHVSFDRVLSGNGLHAIYEFLRDTKKNEPTWFAERLPTGDPPALIAEAGLAGKPDICAQALDLFVSILAAEAGNCALKMLARGGVYLGGGIAPKIIAKIREPNFTQMFIAKGRYKRLLASIPVAVILNDKAALLGAASVAASMEASS